MSSPADQLTAFLLADPGVSGLTTQVFNARAGSESTTAPQVVATGPTRTEFAEVLSGGSQTGPMYEFDVRCTAHSAEAAWNVAQAVASALEDFDDEFKSGEAVEAHVDDILSAHESRRDGSEIPLYEYVVVVQMYDH